MMTVDEDKRATLYRWERWLDLEYTPYPARTFRAARSIDWNRITNRIDIIVTAGYCLDSIVEAA